MKQPLRPLQPFSGPALLARTNFSQPLPGINAQLVAVAPFEFHGIFANPFGRQGLRRRSKHGQSARWRLRRSSRLTAALFPFVVAQSAGAGIPEKRKCIAGTVAIFPDNFHPCPGAQIDFDGFGIGQHCHFSIAETAAHDPHPRVAGRPEIPGVLGREAPLRAVRAAG